MAELIWDGKYDANGRKVAPIKIALPFQTTETVNESTAERNRTRSLFAEGRDSEWRNRLIWGDKKYVLPSLLAEFAGKVNLIYIDPPFDTGANFSFTAQIPDDPSTPGDQSASFVKEPSILELKAYRDIWGTAQNHLDSYLKWFYETVTLLYDLLAPNGSIYVHLDWHMAHYAKLILDEVFGKDNFKNEIIWHYSRWPAKSPMFQRSHDTLFWYGKSANHIWNQQYQELSASTIKRFGGQKVRGETTKVVLEEESAGAPMHDVWRINHVLGANPERIGYPTQKPEALLERIIKASSNEDDLVLDCFCGSGTTAAVAEKLGRRWITCDLGRFAIHTARKRLLGVAGVRPFVVQNLGKYERQAWQAGEFSDDRSTPEAASQLEAARRAQRNYIEFMLKLYRARPLDGYVWLHGVRNGRYVHVGSVDAPVSDGDLKQIAAEFRRAAGSGEDAPATNGIDVLGWDFAFEVNEAAKQSAAQSNIDIKFKIIPREVMEKRAVEQGDIQFFELAALGVELSTQSRQATLQLSDFAIPPDYVPADVARQITSWEQYIDYWAIDWNNTGVLSDTFHNEWQSYRTRTQKTLERRAVHTYDEPGTYRIMVKVIDILGNDTTKVLKVEVE